MYHHTEVTFYCLFGLGDSDFQRYSNQNVSYTLTNSLETFSLCYRNRASSDTTNTTITIDSTLFAFPVKSITKNDNNKLHKDEISTLSTSITNTTQKQPPTQRMLPRTFDPPPPPSLFSTNTTPHNFPPQSSSSAPLPIRAKNQSESEFQKTTPTRQPIRQTLPDILAQTSLTHNSLCALTIKLIHTNPLANHSTSKTLLTFIRLSWDFHYQPSLIMHLQTV